MATVTINRIEQQKRIFVTGDPTSLAIPGVVLPGDVVVREDGDLTYFQTAAGLVLGTSMDATPVFAGLTSSDAITISGSASAPAGTVRYVGGAEGGTTALGYNALSGGNHTFRVAGTGYFTISSTALQIGSAGGAYAISGKAATGTNTASGAITLNANTGTGTGAVGGYIFKVPVTTGSGTDAQTLTTILTLDATTVARATFAGAVSLTSPTGGLGYGAGAGGAQTQGTDKATTVVSNTITTAITMHAAELAAATAVSFTFTNSTIASTDTVIVTHQSAGTSGAYTLNAFPGAGSAVISVRNNTAGALSEAIVLRVTVIKSVSA